MTKSLFVELQETARVVINIRLVFVAMTIFVIIMPGGDILALLIKSLLGMAAGASLLMAIVIAIFAPISIIRRRRREQGPTHE